jgi:hypothetical protein
MAELATLGAATRGLRRTQRSRSGPAQSALWHGGVQARRGRGMAGGDPSVG